MAQDLNALLKTLEELNRDAREPGKLTRERAEEEAKRLVIAVKESLANLHQQLPPEALAASGLLVDVFKAQLQVMLRQCGLDLKHSQEMKKLSEDLDNLKRSFIRS